MPSSSAESRPEGLNRKTTASAAPIASRATMGIHIGTRRRVVTTGGGGVDATGAAIGATNGALGPVPPAAYGEGAAAAGADINPASSLRNAVRAVFASVSVGA